MRKRTIAQSLGILALSLALIVAPGCKSEAPASEEASSAAKGPDLKTPPEEILAGHLTGLRKTLEAHVEDPLAQAKAWHDYIVDHLPEAMYAAGRLVVEIEREADPEKRAARLMRAVEVMEKPLRGLLAHLSTIEHPLHFVFKKWDEDGPANAEVGKYMKESSAAWQKSIDHLAPLLAPVALRWLRDKVMSGLGDLVLSSLPPPAGEQRKRCDDAWENYAAVNRKLPPPVQLFWGRGSFFGRCEWGAIKSDALQCILDATGEDSLKSCNWR